MTAFTRISFRVKAVKDTSFLGRWWWTLDHWTVAAIALLIGFGVIMILSATPPVADRLGFDLYYFVTRQLFFLPIGIIGLTVVSLMSPRGIQRLAITALILSTGLLLSTFFIGSEIKGARRWINILSFSLQPSEFVKPAFAVVTAWLFTMHRNQEKIIGRNLAIFLYVSIVAMLLMQPDLGMAVIVSVVWFTQFFLAGLPLIWVGVFVAMGILGGVSAYLFLPHVASRVDRFIDPSSGDSYQMSHSLQAFMNGGAFGRGPGEGSIKTRLPDAHTDFVFAVAAEEFGLIACLILVGLFAFIVLRGFTRVIKETNFFILLAVTGLLVQFGLQALVNMCSTLRLMPTKGMTLPFVSYGGSSLLSVSLCLGMVLALTRYRAGQETGI